MRDDHKLGRTTDDPWFVAFWIDGEIARAAWVASEEDAVDMAAREAAKTATRRDEFVKHVLEAWSTAQDARASMERDQRWVQDYDAGLTDTYPSDG